MYILRDFNYHTIFQVSVLDTILLLNPTFDITWKECSHAGENYPCAENNFQCRAWKLGDHPVFKTGWLSKNQLFIVQDIEGYHMYKCISEIEEIMDFPTYLSRKYWRNVIVFWTPTVNWLGTSNEIYWKRINKAPPKSEGHLRHAWDNDWRITHQMALTLRHLTEYTQCLRQRPDLRAYMLSVLGSFLAALCF